VISHWEFDDPARPDDCLAFHRPSFGRRGGKGSQLGDFDGILASTCRVYLIESKWGIPRPPDPVQLLRHRMMAWYVTHWRKDQDWDAFRRSNLAGFRSEFAGEGKWMPKAQTRLAGNLSYILNNIRHHCPVSVSPENVKDILLLFGDELNPEISGFGKSTFSRILIDCPGEIQHGFVLL
jgi:hypothetical protein